MDSFDDSVGRQVLGISAIAQPGGSLRDQDSIQAANQLVWLWFTGIRHFLH